MIIQIIIFTFSLTLTLLFFLYGFNQYFLLNASRKYKPPFLNHVSEERPPIAIHLPIYNEVHVMHRLVEACVLMAEDYGMGRVKIYILDDSDDESRVEIDEIVEEYSRKHIKIEVLRRENRIGYKAGALQAALSRTEEEFIAIFDADFLPQRDFLTLTIPYFLHNERLGIIQSRWSHLNRDFNLLTKAIAIAIDVHFMVEQTARYANGYFQNFNGSGGLLRKKGILDVGGWQADTLSEDLDISYRMQMEGYHVLYLKDIQSPGEIPPTVPSYKKQQARWARGSLQTAKKILPHLLPNKRFGFPKRFQAFIHLTNYLLHPMMVLSFLLTCFAIIHGQYYQMSALNNIFSLLSSSQPVVSFRSLINPAGFLWVVVSPLIVICAIAPWAMAISTIKKQNLSLIQNLFNLIILFLLGFGVSISNSIEAGKALFTNRTGEFVRTPKYSTLESNSGWRKSNYQVALDSKVILEFFFILLGLMATVFAIRNLNYAILLIIIPYTFAYLFVFTFTILQSKRVR